MNDPLLTSNDVDHLWEMSRNSARNTRVAAQTRLNQLGLLNGGAGVEYDAVRYIDVTEVAKMIRKALRNQFVGFRFTVKCERFAGGTAIYVGYSEEFEKVRERVHALRDLVQGFESQRFDGMTDLASSISCWLSPDGIMRPAHCAAFGTHPEESYPNPGGWELVHSGAKYVFSQRMF